jgi:PPOX class probable F420-dependent enzyme
MPRPPDKDAAGDAWLCHVNRRGRRRAGCRRRQTRAGILKQLLNSLPAAMPSRRDQIRMSDGEVRDFLAEQKIVTVATIGPNDRPHLMSLWYVPREGGELIGWTFAKSQKAKNLERDPRATLLVEDGVEYQELRGVMLECDVEVERDPARVAEFGMAIFDRYAPRSDGGELPPEVREMVELQAPKRIGLTFRPTRTVTWDHHKLGGTY